MEFQRAFQRVVQRPYNEGLTIVVWDVFVSVNVTPRSFHARWSSSTASGSTTMMEDGRIARDMLDRQGQSKISDDDIVRMDPSDWAREWQVRPGVDLMLFETARAPQYPETCWMPDPTLIEERQLANEPCQTWPRRRVRTGAPK